jgi:hypothetical protein
VKPEPTASPATTGATVEYQVRFATGPKGRKRVRETATVARVVPALPVTPTPRAAAPVAPPTRAVAAPTPESPAPAPGPRILKTALLLVLGHHFEHLVRSGVVRDYAEVAKRTGLTRARVTQIVNLTLLPAWVQESMLLGKSQVLPERMLRSLVSQPRWLTP